MSIFAKIFNTIVGISLVGLWLALGYSLTLLFPAPANDSVALRAIVGGCMILIGGFLSASLLQMCHDMGRAITGLGRNDR